MAPADLPKVGNQFDLAIAVGILAASGQVPANQLRHYEFYGELGLSGELRPISACVPFALACKKSQRQAFMPPDAAAQAAVIVAEQVFACDSLHGLFAHLVKQQSLSFAEPVDSPCRNIEDKDMADIVGQHHAKRALEVAAAGNHHALFVGPPGTGKTMLAERLAGILPELTEKETLEVAAIASISHEHDASKWFVRPFRSPHHSASAVALVGGGSQPRPGEITLAHRGVLFLDELPEFARKVLDMLREPMESGCITISRAANQVDFPAQFQLVAALNPSPSGHHKDKRCTPDQALRYLNKLSGPFLDRIDIQVEVPLLPADKLRKAPAGETSSSIRQRVYAARERQLSRCGQLNAQLTNKQIRQHCALSRADEDWLQSSIDKLGLSVRAYHRILKVARSIADLANEEHIGEPHLIEALSYRAMDKVFDELLQF